MMRRRPVVACAVVGAVLGVLAVAQAGGLRINTTSSMPVGLWWITPMRTRPARGDIVAVCLPEGDAKYRWVQRGYIASGSCPDGTEPLLKPVAAIGGDVVMVSADGIAVNGRPIANTAPLARDEAGRSLQPLAVKLYCVASGELWVLSTHDMRSFDSRYFGAVAIADVLGRATPIWVLP